MKLLDSRKKFYRGNLHTHTTLSDGFLDPEVCAKRYKDEGYDFIAITDHRVYFPGKYDDKDFIILSGEEFMHEDYVKWTAYHIIGIGQTEHFESTNDSDPQEIIDGIKQRGGFAIMGHPYWSLMSHQEIFELKNLDALEVFSGISEQYSNRGTSAVYSDVLATMGMPLRQLGVDDMHFNKRDIFQGWIMLQTDDFSKDGIMKALYEGTYYATEGPEIYNLEVKDGRIIVDSSEVMKIAFQSNMWYNANRVIMNDNGTPVTHGEYEIVGRDQWIRIEGTTFEGKKFSSNFIINENCTDKLSIADS